MRMSIQIKNVQAKEKLQTVINQLKTFETSQSCEEYIRGINDINTIILIVSGRYGKDLIPKIQDLIQLNSVYVYCMDVKANEIWAKKHPKV